MGETALIFPWNPPVALEAKHFPLSILFFLLLRFLTERAKDVNVLEAWNVQIQKKKSYWSLQQGWAQEKIKLWNMYSPTQSLSRYSCQREWRVKTSNKWAIYRYTNNKMRGNRSAGEWTYKKKIRVWSPLSLSPSLRHYLKEGVSTSEVLRTYMFECF